MYSQLLQMSASMHEEQGLDDGITRPVDNNVQPAQQQGETGKRKSRVNWVERELLVLQAARREDMQRYALGGSKAKKQKTGDQRWKAITEACLSAGVERTAAQCKDKWESLHAEWKRIYDYENDIPPMSESYWNLTNKQRKTQRLPTSFFNSVYHSMAAWCGQSIAVDSEDILIEDAHASEPGTTCKSTPTTSEKGEEYELNEDHGNVQDDMSTLPLKLQGKDEQSAGVSTGGLEVKPEQTKSIQDVLQLLEKSNSLLVSVLTSSEERKDARHQELMKFEREKYMEERELARRKLELSEQLGVGYINALHNIGENIKLLGQAIMQGSKNLS
ncbi:unnamed protein product [Calypogeia fissa]